jgi:lambda repressor-like predicted transcriptional regulator
MDPMKIRVALLLEGYTCRRVAKELGLTDGTVGSVLHGHAKSRRVANKISDVTGISISVLFPGSYNAPTKRTATQIKKKRRGAAVRGR